MTEPADVFPSARWRHALSWWWVAELVRRHPYLDVREQVSGSQDSLVLAKPVEGPAGDTLERRMEINRNGSIHLLGRQVSMMDGPWGQLLDAEDPHAQIHQMESAAGLGHPKPVPPVQANSLAFRLVSAVLMAKVHDPESWECRADGDRWVLLRGAEPMAYVDLDGHVQLAGDDLRTDAMAAYEAHDQRLIPTMSALFGPML